MRTVLVVNRDKFLQNLNYIRGIIDPQVKLLAVVKADAYGHGAVEIAKECLNHKVDYFGVATLEEAIELREAGIKLPILILTEPVDCGLLEEVLYYDFTLTVYSRNFIIDVGRISQQFKKKIKVHLKVDTGMHRVGVPRTEALEQVENILKEDFLSLEGVYTHLAEADNPDKTYTLFQLAEFEEVIKQFREKLISIPLIHVANSSGTINFPEAHYNMVRVGIALYRNILTFSSKVIFLKAVKAGESVGYGKTYKALKNMVVAIVSVGYADGYSRLLSNQGVVLIKGKRCRICGNVCMDMIMVEVDNKVEIGDKVTLIGCDGKETITAQDIATLTKTIDYEVMCSIGKRVPRQYCSILGDSVMSVE